MSNEPRLFLIRATHQYGFRFGEWAEVTGVHWQNNRPCYAVRFIDGAADSWPIYDPADPYEFKPYGSASLAASLHRRAREDAENPATPESPATPSQSAERKDPQ